jgi:phosphatidylglycerophosphate synthase
MIPWAEFKEKSRRTYKLGWRQKFIGETALPITWLIAHTPITPNQVTIFWTIIQIISPFLILKGDYWSILIGLTIYQCAIFFDAVDGQLARFKGTQSFAGLYFDQIGHYLTIPILIVFLGIGLSKYYHTIAYTIIGIMGMIFFVYTKLLTFNPHIYGISNVKDVADILNTPIHSFRYSKNKLLITVFEWLRIEHPFNLLWLSVLLGYGHVGLILHTFVFGFELIRKIITQTKELKKVDEKLRYTSH